MTSPDTETTTFPAVETIRRAATLMRERALAATPGPWVREWAFGTHFVCPDDDTAVAASNVSRLKSHQRADAEHIASWHPAVALAVADWLDIGANPYACVDRAPMVAVARAYLTAEQAGGIDNHA